MKIVPKYKKCGIIGIVTKKTREETLKNIGARVRSLRENKSWSQEDLAKASGLKRSHISLIENSERTPGAVSLVKLADALETSLDFLTGRSDDPNPRPLPNCPALLDPRIRALIEAWPALSEPRRNAIDAMRQTWEEKP